MGLKVEGRGGTYEPLEGGGAEGGEDVGEGGEEED